MILSLFGDFYSTLPVFTDVYSSYLPICPLKLPQYRKLLLSLKITAITNGYTECIYRKALLIRILTSEIKL